MYHQRSSIVKFLEGLRGGQAVVMYTVIENSRSLRCGTRLAIVRHETQRICNDAIGITSDVPRQCWPTSTRQQPYSSTKLTS